MFKGKEIKAETIEKILELDKRDLELLFFQIKGVVKVGLKNGSVTALTVAETFRRFADGDE